MCHNWIG